jgi:endonuclease-3
MDNKTLAKVLTRIRKAVKSFRSPAVTQISLENDPFRVLVSCLLSLRTRDEVTEAASERLFALADTPESLLLIDQKTIEEAIYPVAFFRNKAANLHDICHDLIADHQGRVPDSIDELLKLKGVGRKTANLTVVLGHQKMGICVDIHVHRICNRLGYVKTQAPDETERVLRQKLPKRYWREINDLLVAFGQNICKPVSPFCSLCSVAELCAKVAVDRSR